MSEHEQERRYLPHIGLDVGTAFLQVAKQRNDGMVEFTAERDAFYAMTPNTPQAAKMLERSLQKQGVFTLKSGKTFYLVGEKAIEMAMVRGGTTERPLKSGVLSMSDVDSMGMLAILLEALTGKATTPNELCVYSYPADPVDADFDAKYHHDGLAEILGNLGFKPVPLLEAEALAYSELMDDDLTGIAISCGAGMHNLAVFHMGENLLSFSIAQGGDFIDRKVAQQLNISETAAQAEKEAGIDLNNPEGRIQKIMVVYFENLIDYVVSTLAAKFAQVASKVPKFSEPVPVVISGGTSLAKGYLDRMKIVMEAKDFPFTTGEVRHAANPLTAVANGCLIYAQMYEE